MRASLWLIPGGLHDARVGQTKKMLDGHLGSEPDQEGKRVVLPDRVAPMRRLRLDPLKLSGQTRTINNQLLYLVDT